MGQVNLSASEFLSYAKNECDRIIATRRFLHQHPELSFKEYQTAAYIKTFLDNEGIPYTDGFAGTGIVALIKGVGEGPVVLLRADMDALPIIETNEVDYRSVNQGVMHACGHDVHTTCLLFSASLLNQTKSLWQGTIKLMFQPGEEVLPGGASLMIAEGVLENPKVERAIALHVFPSMETGKVGFRKGIYMASTDELYLSVKGKGGHAAMPDEYSNPILALSEILLAYQNKFMRPGALKGTRGEDIPTVVAFGKLQALGATNVIPELAKAEGTMRTMNEAWRKEIQLQLQEIASEIALKYGVAAKLEVKKGYPCVVNDADFTEICSKAASELIGNDKVEELPLRMTAEDFAFITQKVPSCFFRLGTGNSRKGTNAGVHTSNFDIDEDALPIGVATMAWLAIKALGAI
jgi:amidohydrolase